MESQKLVLEHLGITHLRAIAGGSLGGMQVLMWAAMYPDVRGLHHRHGQRPCRAGAPASPGTSSAARSSRATARFHGGDYYDIREPLRGLQVARMVGHMTYLSQEALQRKFGRRRRGATRQFEIDSYFEYQGKKFAALYDANSYIRVQAAMDEMDLDEQYGDLQSAFARWRGRTLLVSFDTDWLFPPRESERVASAMRELGTDASHFEVASANGHDTFLIDFELIDGLVREFLGRMKDEG